MAKTKKTPAKDEVTLASLRQRLKRTKKLVTKDGQIKKKVPKQFTEYQCNVCCKKFTDKSNLSHHQKLHLDMEYPCDQCSYIARTNKYLCRHKRSKHSKGKIECPLCERRFHHPCALKKHMMVHTGEKPLRCEICSKAFRAKYSLDTHMLIHKDEKPYKCTFCTYACRDSSTLRKHEYRHMGIINSYCCKICPKKFDTKAKLKQHITEVHLNYLEIDHRTHKCQKCDKAFKAANNLRKHVLVMHTKLPGCPCPICGKRIKHESYLRAHLRTHFPERPHVCAYDGCGKAFKSKGDLSKHAVIHARARHAVCSLCGATFARAYRLVSHMRTHEPKVKHVVCDYCNVKFYSKNYLINHIKKKHSESKRRYICDHCGLGTNNKPSIVMHLKYGTCRGDKLMCTICKTTYKHLNYLRSHYLKTHKMRYKTIKRIKKEKKPLIEIKVEPVDDPYEEVQLSLLEVNKEEIEIEEDIEKEEGIENDLVDYSKKVLSEDLQCLLDEASKEKLDDGFDEFLLNHVFNKQVKEEEPNIAETNEEQVAVVTQKIEEVLQKAREKEADKKIEKIKRKKAKILERKLKREAKIMRRKRRREKYELERVRQMYNERMRKATAQALVKEPAKKVKYFQKKPNEKANNEKETEKNKYNSADIVVSLNEVNSCNNTDSNKDIPKNEFSKNTNKTINLTNTKNTEKDVTVDIVTSSNNNNGRREEPEAPYSEHNNNEIDNAEKEPIERTEAASNEMNTTDEANRNDTQNSEDSVANNTDKLVNDIQDPISDQSNLPNDENDVSNDTVNKTNDQGRSNDEDEVINDIDNTKNKDMSSKLDKLSNDKQNSVNDQNLGNNKDNVLTDAVNKSNEQDRSNDKDKVINDIDNAKHQNIYSKPGKLSSDEQNLINEQNLDNDENDVTNDTDNKSNDQDRCNDKDEVLNDIDATIDKDMNSKSDKLANDLTISINDQCLANDINDVTNDTINKSNEHDRSNDKDKVINDIDNAKGKDTSSKSDDMNKNDDDNVADDNDDLDDDKSDYDSDYNPDSEDESAPSKKMKFQTFQCYVCFKLYPTKEELMSHCASHFDICNSTLLSKCPACGHVVSRNISQHMKIKHGIKITIPHTRISTRDDGEGSKYCYKMADTVMEIIPSVKMLNHSASIEIDKRNREKRDKTVAKTRLVKKGSEWIVEKYSADVNYPEMPEFTEQELSKLPVSDNYVERMGQLGRLARSKGVRIMYPCQDCDKICQNFSALKLHVRRHDPHKKPFAPRKRKRDALDDKDKYKVKNIENRSAKPQPIKNNHKCDQRLKEFYKTHIRGADIEFWQFLKIYNKMDRDNVNDFTDLANRSGFGKQIYGESCDAVGILSKTAQPKDDTISKSSNQKINDQTESTTKQLSKTVQQNSKRKTSNLQHKLTVPDSQRFLSKSGQQSVIKRGRMLSKMDQPSSSSLNKKPMYKRVIMISRKQQIEREKLKNMLRQKSCSNS